MSFVAFDELAPPALARVEEIYEENFPPHERVAFDALMIDTCLAFLDDAGDAVGIAVLREMRTPGRWFLRYFAAGEHGRGIGSLMWAELFRTTGASRIVLDVEDPAEPGIDAAQEIERHRRIAFYERLGARVLPVRSYVPPHGIGEDFPMQLLTGTVDAAPDPDDADFVREILLAAYLDRYGVGVDHPVVRRTLVASGLADDED